jgi:hypothetical protein
VRRRKALDFRHRPASGGRNAKPHRRLDLKRRTRRYAQDLRLAIDCLPPSTRDAMLQGVRENEIIVGAYTTKDGGVCPMLAAHRRGGRTNLASFARAWDRYTGAPAGRPRRATERELRTLQAMLEASSWSDEPRTELERAAREAQALSARRETGERDRTPELRHRPGWAWLRIFRRYDEFEDAVSRAGGQKPERERELV